jgi:hypothetical protein
MSLETQPIQQVLETAAAEAFGGAAARPPQALLEGDVAGREAFEARHTAAQAAAQAAADAPAPTPAPGPAPLGNSTFDPAPSELLARRAKVGIMRDRLGNLARLIQSEELALAPLLSDLADDQKIIRESEAFDCLAAQSFLTALGALVSGLATPAKPEKKKA